MEKLIITAAVTGSLATRRQNPNIPYTPEEIARAAIESCEAGASMVHLHMRDPQTGQPKQEADLFKEAITIIRKECNMIVNTTTGGAPGMTFDERLEIIPALASDPITKPDMASFTTGSVNFGILSKKKREFVLNAVNYNPWAEMLRFADTMKENGVKPEVEIFEAGHINNALVLQDIEALEPPLHFQFVLGVLGALQSTIDNLVFLRNSIPKDASWSVCAVGLDIFKLAPTVIAMGGHIRVGLEDGIHVSDGVIAESNVQMVEKVSRIAREMGREIASPTEARKIYHLNNL
jgi:3-keto-5-aminohexanoate cleavage enzyme